MASGELTIKFTEAVTGEDLNLEPFSSLLIRNRCTTRFNTIKISSEIIGFYFDPGKFPLKLFKRLTRLPQSQRRRKKWLFDNRSTRFTYRKGFGI